MRITHHQPCHDFPHDPTTRHTACAPCAFPLPPDLDHSLEEAQSTQDPNARRPEPGASAASASAGATSSMRRGSNRGAHVTSTGTRRTSSTSLPLAAVIRAVRACVRRFVRGTCVECAAADTRESETITGGSASAVVCTYAPPLVRAARRALHQSQAARHRAYFSLWPPHHVYKSQLPHLEPPEPCSRPCSRL